MPNIDVPPFWRNLFEDHLPGYDPLAQADRCKFDAAEAELRCEFFPDNLKLAKCCYSIDAGAPFKLYPWQMAIVGCLFGWQTYDEKIGWKRRYTTLFLYIPKKNGKTALAAGLVLCMIWMEVKDGGELYSVASTHEQARIVFDHAQGMVIANDRFKAQLKVYGASEGANRQAIQFRSRNISYKCMTADAGANDGVQPDVVIGDEIHEHPSDDMMQRLTMGAEARPQPLIIMLTTADYNRPSFCNREVEFARAVRDNKGDPLAVGWAPHYLSCIYEAPSDCDWTKPEVWHAANPMLNIITPEAAFAAKVAKAVANPAELNSFLRLRLNIVTDTAEAFLQMSDWKACEKELGDLAGQTCFGGLDLSRNVDLSSFVLFFPETLSVLAWFWLPDERAEDRERKDHVPYSAWAREGFIDVTPTDTINKDAIHDRLLDLSKLYNIRSIGFDPRFAEDLVQRLEKEDGLTVEMMSQGWPVMTAPTTELERLVVSHTLRHDGNPILSWMASNVVVHMGKGGGIMPDKSKSSEMIDGIVALCMAIGQATLAEPPRETHMAVIE